MAPDDEVELMTASAKVTPVMERPSAFAPWVGADEFVPAVPFTPAKRYAPVVARVNSLTVSVEVGVVELLGLMVLTD